MSSMGKQVQQRVDLEVASRLGLPTGTRSARTSKGPRVNSVRCSMVRSIPLCIVWRSGMGRLQMGNGARSKSGVQIQGKQMTEAVVRLMWPSAEES
jgi:hypothetical protein